MFGFADKGVLVDVEYAPDVVVPQVGVLAALGLGLRILLELDGQLHHCFGNAAGYNFHFDQAALLKTEVPEIARLGDLAVADDQETRERLAEARAAA